jgi:hypothetical protein
LVDVVVPEPERQETRASEIIIALSVSSLSFVLPMLPAIDFDDQLPPEIDKVDNEWPCYRLPPEMPTEFPIESFEVEPKLDLMSGESLAHATRSSAQILVLAGHRPGR